MKEFSVSSKPELDIKKYQNLTKEREKIIKFGFTDQVKTDYKTNELVKIFHPKEINVEIREIKEETEDTKSFYLKPVDIQEFPPFEAGQYITVEVKINNGIYKRAYSISSSPNNLKEYRITVKKELNGLISNYLFYEAKEKDRLKIHGPFGNFKYNKIRDKKDVLAICGGSGITPIMALIYSCIEKKRPSSVTLLYGAKTERDIIFKKELDNLAKKNKELKIIYVLSEEKRPNYEYGFIDKEKLLKQEPLDKTLFICGPNKMYQSLNGILKGLDIPNKFIRHEIYTEKPEVLNNIEHQLHVRTNNKIVTIPCFENETLLNSMEKSGINAPVHCTVGVCGFCRSKLINGKVQTENSSLRAADLAKNYIHPCVTYPLSDVTLELPF